MANLGKPNNDMTKLEVVIAGEIIILSADESAEYMQRVARYIDKKMLELGREKKVVSFNSFAKTLLLAINIADDLFKEMDTNEGIRMEYATLQTEHAKLRDECDMLKSASRVTNQKLDEQLNASAKLFKELGTLKAQSAETDAEKSTMAADYNSLLEEHQAALIEIEGMKKANDSLLRNNQSIMTRLEDLQKANQALREDLARANAEIESARRELEGYIETFSAEPSNKQVYKFKK
ncbi:MAG: cell division protein ZapA [Defluviitaleaceae bacterium]|nr:cell division protein ZapA [Defluviitaleaceae bacterium]